MIEKISNGIIAIVKNDNIKEFAHKKVIDLVDAILSESQVSAISTIDDVRKLLWQIPNALFWDKMFRFMTSTFSDYEYQIRMCEKFQTDNNRYKEFVKKLIQVIEKLDFDEKVDWFANLTRSFLMELLNEDEYFKLSFALRQISSQDLLYLKELVTEKDKSENGILNILYQHSLTNKYTPNTCGSVDSVYNISELGIKLLKYGLDMQNKETYKMADNKN